MPRIKTHAIALAPVITWWDCNVKIEMLLRRPYHEHMQISTIYLNKGIECPKKQVDLDSKYRNILICYLRTFKLLHWYVKECRQYSITYFLQPDVNGIGWDTILSIGIFIWLFVCALRASDRANIARNYLLQRPYCLMHSF